MHTLSILESVNDPLCNQYFLSFVPGLLLNLGDNFLLPFDNLTVFTVAH